MSDPIHPKTSETQTKRSSSKKTLLIGAVIIIAGAGLWRFSTRHTTTHLTADQTTPVAVAAVTRGDMPVIFTELGTVIPITNVTVQTRVSGYLMKVLYTEGQEVKEGDLLELIDPRPYEAQLKQYQGQLIADQAQLAQARMDYTRYLKLQKHDAIDTQTAQDQKYKVEQLEGTVQADEGLIQTYKLDIEYCHIYAPVSGRIGIRAVDRGNYVAAGQTNGLATLAQMSPISVIFTVPQDKLSTVWKTLRKEKTLPVQIWDSENAEKLADGTVSSLDSELDTSTGTVKLRALLPNADENLFPNQFVNAHLIIRTEHNVLLMPETAVQTGPDGSYVYLTDANNTVHVQNVKLGTSQDTTVVITDGLKEGDKVVISGVDHLRNGSRISIPANSPVKASGNGQ